MPNFKNILTLVKKELRSYLNNPSYYIIFGVFVLLLMFFHFRTILLVEYASLYPLFGVFPWLCLLFIPALTMGSVARERQGGTLEVILAHPVSELEFILAKFLSTLIFILAALIFVLIVPLSLKQFGAFDWGVVLGQYLGALFFSASLIALGIFSSSVFSSQVVVFIVSALASFFFLASGSEMVILSLPPKLSEVLEGVSILVHYGSVSRGTLDVRDLMYFVSFGVAFLTLAWLSLIRRKLGNRAKIYRRFKFGAYLFVGAAIFANSFGTRIPGRLDLTAHKTYSFSTGTKKLLAELQEIIYIDFYASDQLPPQLQPKLREIKNVLEDYEAFGKGKVIISHKSPKTGEDKQEAFFFGISPVQFNIRSEDQFQAQQGYLGMRIYGGEDDEVIPFVENTADLEYDLARIIVQLSQAEKKTIAFLSGHGEKVLDTDYTFLKEELGGRFNLEKVEGGELPSNTKVVVVAGPTEEIPEDERAALREFLENGGSALFLLDAVVIEPETLEASINPHSFADFVEEYGVAVGPNLLYDVRSNETVRFSAGTLGSFVVAYPFWPRIVSAPNDSPVNASLSWISLPWASPLSLDEEKLSGAQVDELFKTTEFGGIQSDPLSIYPQQDFSLLGEGAGEYLAAVALQKDGWRMVVVGEADFLADEFSQTHWGSFTFGVNAIEWLSLEEGLAEIRSKRRVPERLLFKDANQKKVVKYANFSFVFAAVLGVGGWRVVKRKRLRKRR